MEKKMTKVVGISKAEFDEFIKSGAIHLSQARLIPTYKPGDEMALTSVILSGIRLIKEFRKIILSEANIISSGQIYVYTEAGFSRHKEFGRADGLLIVVKGGTIKDAALFEIKNGNDELSIEQLERYQLMAREYSIPKLITVSNQFVSEPSQCPVGVKNYKNVEKYHFSWSYLLTIAHVLLFKNDNNISDEDQVEIMKEIVSYLEDKKSGVLGFHQMKAGWKDVTEKIITGATLKAEDNNVCDAVISWQQEEKDMALILSRSLGVIVESGEKKYRGNLAARWSDDKNSLLNEKMLVSTLRVKDAISDIRITGLLEKKAVEMLVSLKAPQDKTTRGRLSWMRKQFEHCKKKNEKTFESIRNNLFIDVRVKNSRSLVRMSINKFDDLIEDVKDREIVEFNILYIIDFGRNFSSPKKFVDRVENMLLDFYSGVVQYLWKWEPSAPKMVQPAKEEYIEPSPEKTPIQETSVSTIESSDEGIQSKSSLEASAGDEQGKENL